MSKLSFSEDALLTSKKALTVISWKNRLQQEGSYLIIFEDFEKIAARPEPVEGGCTFNHFGLQRNK